jgi:NitT/TauT family transport system ATP-binding protein
MMSSIAASDSAGRSAVMDAAVSIEQLSVRFGDVVALQDISLAVQPGEFVAIVGPSGCGKTTLLNAISGLLPPEAAITGKIRLRAGTRLGYVFQKDALLPWFSALRNVEVGAELRGVARAERRRLALELLQAMGLEGFAGHYPHQLSGGMRHRVALARALAYDPDVVLLDEPFGALDAFTRLALEEQVLGIWRRTGKTMLLVTHDLAEALSLGKRIVVLTPRPGRIHAIVNVSWPEDLSLGELRTSEQFFARLRELWDLLLSLGAAPGRAAKTGVL